jgi:L-threonylcarbamoyladenylate synthase
MKTTIFRADSPRGMTNALAVLRQGGLVGFPTDTVYGLGALAFSGLAVAKLYPAKGRPESKAIPVLVDGLEGLQHLVWDVSPEAEQLARRFWPGPLTLILHRRPELPAEIGPGDSVGVRMPNHPVALHLLAAAGPLAVTSANRSGEPECSTADAVLAALGGRFDLLLDGGPTPGGLPSTVIDCTQSPAQILRQGPIARSDIEQVLGPLAGIP